MKKIFVLSFIIALIAVAFCSVSAQTTGTQVGDPTSYMTPAQLAKYENDIKTAELEKKLETYGEWVGVGGEVGIAVREGLNAVVDVADKFGGTDVGKFTMILVAWKVVGKDLVRIILGILFIIAISILIFRVYKNTFMVKRVMVERTPNGWFQRATKEYTVVEPDNDWDGYNFVRVLMIILYAGAFGITYAIMFG